MKQQGRPALITHLAFRTAASILCLALMSGCTIPESKPDGSCGIRGKCFLPPEPPGEDGKVPACQPWAGIEVTALRVNSPHADYKTDLRTKVDQDGAFQLALNPGEYVVGVRDPVRLKGKALSPLHLKVEAGRYTEVVLDDEKLKVRDAR